MTPVPPIQLTPGATHLMSGAALNRLVAAVQARTQMDARSAGPKGMLGRNKKGGSPKIPSFRQRFEPHRTYVLSPGFLERLTDAIKQRTPREAGSIDPEGWGTKAGKAGKGGGIHPTGPVASASSAGLQQTLDAVQQLTPRNAWQVSPLGYRFAPDPRPPRTIKVVLQTQYRWAQAFYCSGVLHDNNLYTTLTITARYQNGDIVTVKTQPDIGPHLWNASNPTMPVCPGTTTYDNQDPTKVYGDFKSSSFEYAGSVNLGDAYDVAAGNVQVDGEILDAGTWQWLETADPPVLASSLQFLMATWLNPSLGTYEVRQPRYRWANMGELPVVVRWTEAGTNREISLAAGETCDWYLSTVPVIKDARSVVNAISFVYNP